MQTIGEPGNGPAELNVPQFLFVNSNDQIVVFERNGQRISIFKTDGAFVNSFKIAFARVLDIATDSESNIYVCAYSNQNAIHKFSLKGDSLLSFAAYEESIHDSNYFLFDGKIAVDRGDKIYYVSSAEYAIKILTSTGQIIKIIHVDKKTFAVPRFKRSDNTFQSNQMVFVTGLFADENGTIFHQYWNKADNEFIFDIFSPEGIFLYSEKKHIELNPDLKGFLADVRQGRCYFFRTRPYSFMRRYRLTIPKLTISY